MAMAFDSASSDQYTDITDLTLVVNAPTGASVDGRLLIAQCLYTEGAPGYGSNIEPPAGWNEILVQNPINTTSAVGVGGGYYRSFTWVGWKITDNEPATYQFNTPMNTPPFVLILGSCVDIVCYTGVNAVSPFDTYETTFTTTNADPDFDLPAVNAVNGVVPAITYTQSGNFTWGVGSQLVFNDDDDASQPIDVMWRLPGANIVSSSPISTVDYEQLGPGAPTYGRTFARPAALPSVLAIRVSFDLRFIA